MLATRRSGSKRPNASRNGRATPRFEVLDRLGEGTLWITYRVQVRAGATEEGLTSAAPGGLLALKALRNTVNRIARLRDALEEVAKERIGLSHEGLATLHEVGTEQDTLYILTDLLPGGSLESRLVRGALKPEEARFVLRQLTLPLAYLHSQDLVHGDIRPRQVLFDAQGHPVLTDAGFAQAFANAGMALADVQSEVAHYLAPERTLGGSFSSQSDVYALGVLFYRTLTGRVPFDGPSALAIAARHRNDVVLAPSQLNPRVPGDLDDLALRMLAKDPTQRPTIEQVLVTLRDKSETKKPSAPAKNSVAAAVPVVAAPVVAVPSAVPASAAAPTVVSEPDAVPASTPTVDPKVPRRRPMKEIVDETLADEAKQRNQQDFKKLKRRHQWREFWGLLGAVFMLLLLLGAGAGMMYGAYTYWIDDIPKEVTVPAYLNKDQEDARKALSKKGLYMKIVRETYDPSKPAGTVIAGEPEPGRHVRARREVLVTVSAGQEPIRMVDFSRLSVNQARQIITQHGMRLGPVQEQYSDQVPQGFICGQYPEAGEAFRRSEAIALVVSRGPQPKDIGVDEGSTWQENPSPTPSPTDAANLGLPSDDFAPLQTVKETLTDDGLIERTVKISITVPKGDGNQIVRIIVIDARGENTAYLKTQPAGVTITRAIKVVKAQAEVGQIRVFVGDTLVRQAEV